MAEPTANEWLDLIANMSLELLQTRVETRVLPGKSEFSLVKEMGEALKALAEGIEAYKKFILKDVIAIPK